MRLFSIMALVTLCVASIAGAAIVDLGVIGADTWSTGIGINSSKMVSGNSVGAIYTAFSYQAGVKTPLPAVVGTASRTDYSEGINDSGDIVGYSNYNQGVIHPTLWRLSGGVYTATDLGSLGADLNGPFKAAAVSINAAGNRIGGWAPEESNVSAWLPVLWDWDGSSWGISILPSNGFAGQVNAISDVSDMVAGNSQGDAAVWDNSGGVWSRTILTNPYPGGQGVGSRGYAMDALGRVIVGQGKRGDGRQRAARWKWGGGTIWTASQLGVVTGSTNSIAYGISSNAFFTVGTSWYTSPASGSEPPDDGTKSQRATIWFGKELIARNLNDYRAPADLGWNLLSAYGANDTGWITGVGIIGGQKHGFLMGPIPEPSSLCTLMMGAAACGLGLLRRRR